MSIESGIERQPVAVEATSLINRVQNEDKGFLESIKAGAVSGADESLHDGYGHLARVAITGAAGYIAGNANLYGKFGKVTPWVIGTACVTISPAAHSKEKSRTAETQRLLKTSPIVSYDLPLMPVQQLRLG